MVGENTSAFGIPQSLIMNLVELEKEEYAILFSTQNANGDTTYQMYRYAYDKTVKAKPSQILTVYGLEESNAVRQAIVKYQQKHPDVGIEYKTANVEEGTGTKADSIRALNTELLGGSGADVIMLDGLPVESYIEKGVLGDLSDVLQAAEKESELRDNLIDPYKQDGKIYEIPTRYGIPILGGSSEKTEIVKSADALKEYMKSHEWNDIMEGVEKDSLMSLLTNIYYTDIVDEKQNINTQLLAELIEIAGKAEKSEDVSSVFIYGGAEGQRTSDWNVGKIGDTGKKDTVFTQEMKGIQGMMIPFHYLRKASAYPSDINGIYVPHDIAGINKASENKDLAEDFIKMLLSDDVQEVDVESGFPVNENAIKAWIQSIDENPDEEGSGLSISASPSSTDGVEDSEPVSENITFPKQSEVQALADMGKKLTVPVQKDDIIGEMILDGAKTYFDGSQSAEEAAKDIAKKAATYLAE